MPGEGLDGDFLKRRGAECRANSLPQGMQEHRLGSAADGHCDLEANAIQ